MKQTRHLITVPPHFCLTFLSSPRKLFAINCLSTSLTTTFCSVISTPRYKPCHCTEDAMLNAVDWISRNSERGEFPRSLPPISVRPLIASTTASFKARMVYGIDTEWFRSYLSGRRQLVRGGVGQLCLSVLEFRIGWSILFSLFTNDLHCHLGRVTAYADDTQLLDHSLSKPQNLVQLKLRIEISWTCYSLGSDQIRSK